MTKRSYRDLQQEPVEAKRCGYSPLAFSPVDHPHLGEIPPIVRPEKCWLRICNSMRTRPGWVDPKVWFRVVHAAGDGHHDAPVAAYREQTVEIALGPRGRLKTVISAPRVVKLLHNAIEWRRQLDAGEVRTQADIARREGITRARVTQVMRLLRLAPEFQEQILRMPDISRRSAITKRQLRPMIIVAVGARQEKPIASLMP